MWARCCWSEAADTSRPPSDYSLAECTVHTQTDSWYILTHPHHLIISNNSLHNMQTRHVNEARKEWGRGRGQMLWGWGRKKIVKPKQRPDTTRLRQKCCISYKITYINACAPTQNLSILRKHAQYGSHNSVNAMHYSKVNCNRILYCIASNNFLSEKNIT